MKFTFRIKLCIRLNSPLIFIFILLTPLFSPLFSLFKHWINLQLFLWLGIEHSAITWFGTLKNTKNTTWKQHIPNKTHTQSNITPPNMYMRICLYVYMCLKRKITSPIVIYYIGFSTSINVHRNIPELLNWFIFAKARGFMIVVSSPLNTHIILLYWRR